MTYTFFSPHSHTTFSYGDGFGTPEDHAVRLAELGAPGAVLTEHGNVSSHAQWEKACNAHGLHAAFGCELYTAPPGELSKWHLTAIAETDEGYRNLCRLVSRSWAEGFYRWPTTHSNMLLDHSEGMMITSGCSDSLLACTLLGGKSLGEKRTRSSSEDFQKAVRIARWFQSVYGDGYYLEVQRFPELARTCLLNKIYADISAKTGIPLVATADVHYPRPEQNEMQKILHAALRGGGKTVEGIEQEWEYDIRLSYPLSDRQVVGQLVATGLARRQALGAVAASAEIGQRAKVVLPKNERIVYPTEPGQTVEEMMWEWLRDGWRYRWEQNAHLRADPQAYHNQLKYESGIVIDKKYVSYFLMISEAVRWAKDHGIAVGPARGSAAASLICYLLRITEVDPLQFPHMMFERFLDVSRDDFPDIDLDFADDRRDELRQHLVQVWGADRVGNIGNFVRYRGKNSIDDVARVYRVPKWAAEKVKSLILDRSGGDARQSDSLADTFDFFPTAKAIVEQFPALRHAIDLEGGYRGMSVHAAGLVVSSTPISDTCALYTRQMHGKPVTVLAYDKKSAEQVGMLKVDLLGLSTMSMIARALEIIGMSLEELYTIPLDDPKTLASFKNTDVVGIFQFEGRAQRVITKDVSPDNFLHLADINALSRPGPLFSGVAAEYVARKHGRHEIESLHPIVDRVTDFTYGTIVYQEQVLTIIKEIGGFPVAKVGDIRRIISQKLGEASMNNMRQEFQNGARRLHGIKEDLSGRIWRQMVTSANYSFNIAHCISYSMLGFWCMWLKVHHPLAFYAAQLAKVNDDKRPRLMKDALDHHISILPPHPARSGLTWTPVKTKSAVRAGLTQMPGIAAKKGEAMLHTRNIITSFEGTPDDAPAINGKRYVQKKEDWTWDDYLAVRGIGKKTIEKMKAFAADPDPFGLLRVRTTLENYRAGIRGRRAGYRGLPTPTHTSGSMPDGAVEEVVWMGFCLSKNYQNAVEKERTRSGRDEADIIKEMKDPHLLDSCVLRCYDDGPEDVYLRINRWSFPELAEALEEIVPNEDIVICIGYKRENDFGVSLQVNDLIVVAPDEEEIGIDYVKEEEDVELEAAI